MAKQQLVDPFSENGMTTIDQSTGELLPVAAQTPVNPFLAPKREGYYIPHSPREIRCMCEKSKGYFADATDASLGSEVKFRVLQWREVHGVKFSNEYPEPESVIQCIVVDSKKIVNQMVFRTYSMGNFLNCLTEIELAGVPLAQALITAHMEKHTGKQSGFTFHLVRFTYEVTDEAELADLAQFVSENPAVLSSYKELPTAH